MLDRPQPQQVSRTLCPIRFREGVFASVLLSGSNIRELSLVYLSVKYSNCLIQQTKKLPMDRNNSGSEKYCTACGTTINTSAQCCTSTSVKVIPTRVVPNHIVSNVKKVLHNSAFGDISNSCTLSLLKELLNTSTYCHRLQIIEEDNSLVRQIFRRVKTYSVGERASLQDWIKRPWCISHTDMSSLTKFRACFDKKVHIGHHDSQYAMGTSYLENIVRNSLTDRTSNKTEHFSVHVASDGIDINVPIHAEINYFVPVNHGENQKTSNEVVFVVKSIVCPTIGYNQSKHQQYISSKIDEWTKQMGVSQLSGDVESVYILIVILIKAQRINSAFQTIAIIPIQVHPFYNLTACQLEWRQWCQDEGIVWKLQLAEDYSLNLLSYREIVTRSRRNEALVTKYGDSQLVCLDSSKYVERSGGMPKSNGEDWFDPIIENDHDRHHNRGRGSGGRNERGSGRERGKGGGSEAWDIDENEHVLDEMENVPHTLH